MPRRCSAAGDADVQAGFGYWVYAPQSTQITVNGTPPVAPVQVLLRPGWNFVGNPFDATLPWGDNIEVMSYGTRMPLSEAVSRGFVGAKLYGFDGTGYTALKAGDAMQPWTGYLVKAGGEATLLLQP